MYRHTLVFIFCCLLSNILAAQLPEPPVGYQWVVNPAFTDEFEGDELDKTKWHDRSPYWVHGRAPATFRASAVSVKEGNLQIKNQPLVPATDKYLIAGGAVASVSKSGHFGYYETRMKASGISMSSTFWMKNKPIQEKGCPYAQDELDIVEVIGMRKRGADFNNILHSNTHIFETNCEGKKEVFSSGGKSKIEPAAKDAYHTYGCWWVDENTIKIYLDGQYQFTMNPKKPFNRPMYMHLVTETYNWEDPPTTEELLNDAINTTYYDYVRGYTLAPIAEEQPSLLVCTKTNGFRHASIPNGVNALWEMARKNDWLISFTEDSTQFATQNLAQYDAIIFLNTTQDILGAAGERAFEEYINNGGAFVGIHAATDTEYEWDFYDKMLGAHFVSHPKTQTAKINVHHEHHHAAVAHLDKEWVRKDEWYNFKNPVPAYVNVLLDLDESSYQGQRMGSYHPISWYHTYEGGRIFYTGLGHTKAAYEEANFLTHLEEGIKWAAGITHVPIATEWTDLLDKDLSQWDKFIGVPHLSVEGLEGVPKSEDVHVGTPMGLNNDPKNVFTIVQQDGENVLRASGEIYGGLTSKNEYQNYHLQLKYKWGEKKWAPRINAKRDAGLLYHCTGKHGSFWNVWMRMLEFQIQEGDTGDFFGLAGANAMVHSATTDDKLKYQFVPKGRKYGVGEDYGNWQCRRSAMHEKPHAEWTTIDLYVIGNSAIHVVEGQVVNVIDEAYIKQKGLKVALNKGKLQLQSEGAEIFYKDIRMKGISTFPAAIKDAAGL